MAVPVKRVEREFLLRAAGDENQEIFLSAGGAEWSVRIAEVREATYLKTDTVRISIFLSLF